MGGYCLNNQMDEAQKVLDIMAGKGYAPAVHSYNILIKGNCKRRRLDEAKRLLSEMSEKELTPDTVTYSTLMQGLCQVGRPQEALNLFNEMCSSGLLQNLMTYLKLLDGLRGVRNSCCSYGMGISQSIQPSDVFILKLSIHAPINQNKKRKEES